MNCNVKWNGEKIKIDEIKICVMFEYEWNSGQFSGENGEWKSGQFSGESGDWLSELSAVGEYWGRERERGRRLHLGDWVLGG